MKGINSTAGQTQYGVREPAQNTFLGMLPEEILDRCVVRTIWMIQRRETMYRRCFATVNLTETFIRT